MGWTSDQRDALLLRRMKKSAAGERNEPAASDNGAVSSKRLLGGMTRTHCGRGITETSVTSALARP
jgi:hypothetical protein